MPKVHLFLTVLIILMLAACTPPAIPSPSAVHLPALETTAPSAEPTLTSTVTSTITPTFTAVLTATWTVTPGPTNTSTPFAQFDRFEVTSVNELLGGWRLTVRVPGLDRPLNLIINERKFQCDMVKEAPETLFCQGLSRPNLDQQIDFSLTDPQTGEAVYAGKTYISPAAVPTSTPVGFANCPDRGKKLFCEVECRMYGTDPCIVATCNDACGPYYSIHTCPQDIPFDGICSHELELEMKIKYGLPH